MFYYGEVKYMKKYLYMGAGIIVGGAIALVMYNTKPIKQYIKKCKNSLMVSLDDAMDGETCTIKGIIDTEPRVSYISKGFNRKRV